VDFVRNISGLKILISLGCGEKLILRQNGLYNPEEENKNIKPETIKSG
jgi:hypothetical protein